MPQVADTKTSNLTTVKFVFNKNPRLQNPCQTATLSVPLGSRQLLIQGYTNSGQQVAVETKFIPCYLLFMCLQYVVGRHSSVGMATRYGLVGSVIESR